MKKTIALLVLSFLFTFFIYAQENGFLRGFVRESEENSPISFATIKLQNSSQSTCSNTEGLFSLDVSKALDLDTLLISCIGYEPLKLTLQSIKSSRMSQFLLQQNVVILNEVVITPLQAILLLKEAIKISTSSSPSPYILQGYYRESVKRDSFLTKYADGLVEYHVERKKVNELKTDLRVLQSRAKELPVPEEEKKINELNTPISIGKIINYSLPFNVSALDSNRFKFYEYTLTEFKDSDRELYKIDFKPIHNTSEGVLEGRIYIDKATKLIMAVNYRVAPGSEKQLKSISLFGIKISSISAELSLRFEWLHNVYALKYIKESHGLQISGKKYNQKNDFISELIVTDMQTKNCTSFKDSYEKRTLYKRGNQYTVNFWEDPKLSPNTTQENVFLGSK